VAQHSLTHFRIRCERNYSMDANLRLLVETGCGPSSRLRRLSVTARSEGVGTSGPGKAPKPVPSGG
jgi:hypothetical protein